jgi:hypothetical protein
VVFGVVASCSLDRYNSCNNNTNSKPISQAVMCITSRKNFQSSFDFLILIKWRMETESVLQNVVLKQKAGRWIMFKNSIILLMYHSHKL